MRVYIILALFIGLSITSGKQRLARKCKKKAYEVRRVNGTTFCDNCGRKGLTTPCAYTDCQEGFDCTLTYKSSTDIADCAYGKLPLEAVCKQRCTDDVTSCPTGSYIAQTIAGCRYCYTPSPKDNFKNPCAATNACPEGQFCILNQVICIRAPCPPMKQCKPIYHCPLERKCSKKELPYSDSNGCKLCYSCNGCINMKCGSRKKCVLEQVLCKRCPCPPVHKCV